MHERRFQNWLKNISEMKSDKYKKVVELLRKSEPVVGSTGDIESKVLSSVAEKKAVRQFSLSDCVFGWINIGWLRTSLAGATFFLLAFFIWQQHSMMSEIESLKERIGSGAVYSSSGDVLESKLTFYRKGRIDGISHEDVMMLLDSLKQMSIKYEDLMNMIKNDPELIKEFEKKLDRKYHLKPNL